VREEKEKEVQKQEGPETASGEPLRRTGPSSQEARRRRVGLLCAAAAVEWCQVRAPQETSTS